MLPASSPVPLANQLRAGLAAAWLGIASSFGLAVAGLAVAGLAQLGLAQVGDQDAAGGSAPVAATRSGSTGQPGGGGPQALPLNAPVTFTSLALALHGVPRTQVQLRRFFVKGTAAHGDTAGGIVVVTVREEFAVAADGSADAPSSLRFLGVEGEPAGSPLWQHWSSYYQQHAHTLRQHGGFQVRDEVKAGRNYSLHCFGPTTRAGRAAERVVVFPNRLDKAVWLLDVDRATGLPLYQAEYNAQLQLQAEVEVLSLQLGAQLTGGHQLTGGNQPLLTTTTLTDFAAARAAMNTTGLVQPQLQALPEYGLAKVQILDNPLNARRILVLTYSDGVDEFFVTQAPATSDVFASLPSQAKSGGGLANTMARFRDASISVLTFWHAGVTFQVSGRGSLQRLDELARRVYTQAVLGRG